MADAKKGVGGKKAGGRPTNVSKTLAHQANAADVATGLQPQLSFALVVGGKIVVAQVGGKRSSTVSAALGKSAEEEAYAKRLKEYLPVIGQRPGNYAGWKEILTSLDVRLWPVKRLGACGYESAVESIGLPSVSLLLDQLFDHFHARQAEYEPLLVAELGPGKPYSELLAHIRNPARMITNVELMAICRMFSVPIAVITIDTGIPLVRRILPARDPSTPAATYEYRLLDEAYDVLAPGVTKAAVASLPAKTILLLFAPEPAETPSTVFPHYDLLVRSGDPLPGAARRAEAAASSSAAPVPAPVPAPALSSLQPLSKRKPPAPALARTAQQVGPAQPAGQARAHRARPRPRVTARRRASATRTMTTPLSTTC